MHPTFFGHITDPNNPYAALNWYNAIGAVGCVLWMVAYFLFIRQGFRDRTYGVPMVAICLNITWEAVAASLPNPVFLWKIIEIAWLGIDAVILWQLWVYGKKTMLPEPLQKYHHSVIVAMLVMAAGFHLTWYRFWDDKLLFMDAFIINLVMSVLFITMFFSRPKQEGLSIAGAWCKGIGTFLTGIQCSVFMPKVMPGHDDWSFLWFLVAMIALCDATYIWLLYHGRRLAAAVAKA